MSDRRKSPLAKYLIAILAGLLAAGFILGNNNIAELDLKNQYRILSDAFTVPGMLFLFAGLATWLANEGAFDAFSWLIMNAAKALVPALRDTREKYGDYVERRRGKKTTGYGFLFICGAAFLAVSIVFLLLFKSV